MGHVVGHVLKSVLRENLVVLTVDLGQIKVNGVRFVREKLGGITGKMLFFLLLLCALWQ